MKRRPGFNSQVIGREMRRAEAQSDLEVRAQFFQGLARIRIDEIEAKVVKSGLPHHAQGDFGLIGRVNASEKFEQAGLERLHAYADPIYARGAVADKVGPIDCAWIGLQCDLAIRQKIESSSRLPQNFVDALRVKGRRCPATEENALNASVAPFVPPGVLIELTGQRFRVSVFRNLRDNMGVKIAVRTLANAVGDVDVEGKGFVAGMHAVSS